jgi:hypothetical protein
MKIDFYLNLFFYIIIFISLIILCPSIFIWISKLETDKCECSESWHRDFLKYNSIILPFLFLLSIFLILLIIIYISIMNNYNKVLNETFIKILSILTFIIIICYTIYSIPNYTILLDYIKILKNIDCKCSENWIRDFGYIIEKIYYIYYLLLLLIIIYITRIIYYFYS